MKPKTSRLLFEVREGIERMRNLLDSYMWGEEVPEYDKKYCKKVYDRLCNAEDLL